MSKHTVKSIVAVLAGFITVVILSVGRDFVLESLGIFPPQSEPLAATPLMLLIALIYVALVVTALPCTWLGGKLKTR
jgi:Flp pilus assembly pilin Flp